jgi:hypothetical protein
VEATEEGGINDPQEQRRNCIAPDARHVRESGDAGTPAFHRPF